MTSRSLRNYYIDKLNDAANENVNANYKLNNNKTKTSKSFEYKSKTIGTAPTNNNILNTEVVVPLKYLSNFWRFLDLPLISCEIELDLSCLKDCVISEISRTRVLDANPNANPPVRTAAATQRTSASFQITSSKLCVPVAIS